ncbi:hypothetical protein CB0940_09954 [Cercospora beticola]|uniref:Uncharacterized protein n=1 Tax=Cercospora beticola TaxID=122368 RepID=A0A2G5HHF4_CERBT|nr:hypothetical protein CB0940_09954 [Cercospora beticola]PIA91970.1 hypothetical protein CB0940_09954 [Cercospora beticola]WPB05695.1 hypothetical protein RHO25_010349 [Cercospora beticola]CAK1365541.1 unnamed protein product [Cercospora beticola]
MSEAETENRSSEQESKNEHEQGKQSKDSESSDQRNPQGTTTSNTKGMDKLLNKVPNMSPEGPLGTQTKGPLSAVGDPLGQVLNYSLKPLGHVTGAIGNPHGEALERVQRVAQHEGIAEGEPKYLPDRDNGEPDAELPGGERIGGKEQTGENPLGL